MPNPIPLPESSDQNHSKQQNFESKVDEGELKVSSIVT